jgi:competence protein ComEC
MVTGDTSAVDTDLEGAMRTVGMTHLTAVSGETDRL